MQKLYKMPENESETKVRPAPPMPRMDHMSQLADYLSKLSDDAYEDYETYVKGWKLRLKHLQQVAGGY